MTEFLFSRKHLAIAFLVLAASDLLAQAPTPRFEDGSVNLGAASGETGHWNSGVGNLSENFVEMEGAFLVHPEEIDKVAPFQPWALELVKERLATLGRDDPHPRCMPPGGRASFILRGAWK